MNSKDQQKYEAAKLITEFHKIDKVQSQNIGRDSDIDEMIHLHTEMNNDGP